MKKIFLAMSAFGTCLLLLLAGCGGGGGGDGSTPPPTTTLSGTVVIPSSAGTLNVVSAATTAPALEIRDLSGKLITTVTLTLQSGKVNTYNFSVPGLATSKDYVLKVINNSVVVLRAVVNKAALSEPTTTKDVNKISTTALIIVEKALDLLPGTLGQTATPTQVSNASAALTMRLHPATIENNLDTSLIACTTPLSNVTTAQANLASLINIVEAAAISNVDPAVFISGTSTSTQVTATTYIVYGNTAIGTTAPVTSETAASLADNIGNSMTKISSANTVVFTVGTAGTFTVTGTGALSVSGTLPTGVTFNSSTGVLSGTPVTGGDGTYPLTFTATSSGLTATQEFTLKVNPASIPPTPNAPTGVSATAGDAAVTITWNPVAGATSYNIYYATSSGVTKTTGTKITNTTSPRLVSALSNGIIYFFVVTAVNANGESVESLEVNATPTNPAPTFSQADLEGTWSFIQFNAGPGVTIGTDPGWTRARTNVDGSGNVTVTSIESSDNSATIPPAGSIQLTIAADGVVTTSGTNIPIVNHAVMGANKQLVVGISPVGDNNQSIILWIKHVTGMTFSSADLANTTFSYHELHSGIDNYWAYGAGAIYGSLQMTFSSINNPDGPVTPLPPADSISINANGVVTSSNNPIYKGFVTADKKTIFGTYTTDNRFVLSVFQLTGQTFSQADMAGIWRSHAIESSSTPAWDYSTISFNNTGVGTITALTTSAGNNNTLPPPFTMVLSASGTITQPDEPTLHGTCSYNKDIIVFTRESVSSRKMGIVLK